MNNQRDIERGEQAKRLLENPLLNEALDKIEASLIDSWRSSGEKDHERREDAWRSYQLLGRLRGELQYLVATGKAARQKELLKAKPQKGVYKR